MTLIIDYITEVFHRITYDRLFNQKVYKTSLKEKFIFFVYNKYLCKNKGWRFRIKNRNTLLNRAYNQRKLNFKNYIIYLILSKRNYDRYELI